MKHPFFKCVFLIASLSAMLCHGQEAAAPAAIEEMRQMPEIVLDRKSEFSAECQILKSANPELSRYGFAFKTPTLVDGPATWLVVWDHESPDTAVWEVTKEDGTILIVLSPETLALGEYPELVAKFPKAKSLQRLRIPNYHLVKARRYQAILTTRTKVPPLGISINVAASGVGVLPGSKVQEMEIPQGPVPSQLVMDLVENIRAFKGDAAAIAFLNAQLGEKAENGDFSSIYLKVWNEAQFGAGMGNPIWGSMLNDAAFTSAYKSGRYEQAFDIMINLCGTLGSAARFGRLAEVHALLADGYQRGGLNMNPSSYRDLGPAIPSLPSVRHRDITIPIPYSKQAPQGAPPLGPVSEFEVKQASALLYYSEQLIYRGDWQGALEWAVWIRDWASDKEGNPIQDRNEVWYSASFDIASHLLTLGYTEEALAVIEEAVAAPFGKNYRGRMKISASRIQIDLKRQVGRPDPEMIPKLRELVTVIENHVHFGKSAAWYPKNNLAAALISVGQTEEGEKILDQIVAEGSYHARWSRLDHWLAKGKTDGVEAELIALLKNTREFGHKISELGLYSKYAKFLESTGRYQEALAMRQEAIRLARDFSAFTKLPVQLAELAALLHKLGHGDLAAKAADEARGLLKAGSMPPSTIESVTKSLAGMATSTPTQDDKKPQPAIDMQPQRGMVIPLEGAPWTSYLTLTNPGSKAVRGTLQISGAPLAARVDEETGDIHVELGEAGDTSLALTLTPASFRLITVASATVTGGQGEVKLNWKSQAGNAGDDAIILIDEREQGVAGAIIQAGEFQANPFYGVPIHLSYVAKDQRAKSSPLRFRASQLARVEIYRLDGTPLAVDGNGNGSLLDPGDALFAETDGAGSLLLALADGSAPLQIVAFPQGPINGGGLQIDVEAFDDGKWRIHSSNRIIP